MMPVIAILRVNYGPYTQNNSLVESLPYAVVIPENIFKFKWLKFKPGIWIWRVCFFFLNKQRQNYRIWIQGFQFFWKICKMWKGLKRTRECFSTLLLEVKHRYECISNWFKKKRPGNRIGTPLCSRVHTDRCCSRGRSARLTWWTFAESYQSRSQCRLMAVSYRAGVGKVREDVSGCNLLISAGEIAGQNTSRFGDVFWAERLCRRVPGLRFPRAWDQPWSSAKAPARAELKHTGLSFWGSFA